MQYEVDASRVLLKLTASDIIALEEDYVLDVKYFPMVYVMVMFFAAVWMEFTED